MGAYYLYDGTHTEEVGDVLREATDAMADKAAGDWTLWRLGKQGPRLMGLWVQSRGVFLSLEQRERPGHAD